VKVADVGRGLLKGVLQIVVERVDRAVEHRGRHLDRVGAHPVVRLGQLD
jgi:hypothetical protein